MVDLVLHHCLSVGEEKMELQIIDGSLFYEISTGYLVFVQAIDHLPKTQGEIEEVEHHVNEAVANALSREEGHEHSR